MRRPTPAALALQSMPATRLQATVGTLGEPLRAPASGTPCVHWRLRVFEEVGPGMEFVHELLSPEPLELDCRMDPARPPVRVRLAPVEARIQAMPVLFRPETPGALAVARQFGLRGRVRVEEVIMRPGEVVEAEGVLSDPGALPSAGPFRTIDAPMELLQATLRMEAGLSLRPVLLPWALGMAAMVVGTAGVATALWHWLEDAPVKRPSLPGVPPEIGAKRIPHPRWP
jgi:hypothetical protein